MRSIPGWLVAWAGWLSLTLALSAQPALEVSPLEPCQISGFPRGPFDPPSRQYAVTNRSEGVVSWAVLKTEPWFSVVEAGGTLGAGEGVELRLFPNSLALDLEVGSYEGMLVITNVGGSESWDIAVQLELKLPAVATTEFVTLLSSNQLDLVATGDSGVEYVLEESVDLENWWPRQTNVVEADQFHYPVDLRVEPRKYYRTVASASNAAPSQLSWTNLYYADFTQVRLMGEPGGTYLVEASADGIDWAAYLTNQLPAAGSAVFTNALAGEETNWMYRVAALGPFPAETLHHVLVVGQSLAAGATGTPVLSTEPSPRHYRFFNVGNLSSLVRLVETGLETITSGAGAHLTNFSDHRLLFSNTAVGGAVYDELKRGTEPYARGIRQVYEAPAAVARILLRYQPTAIFVVHGEGDHINPEYELDIRQWQLDYESDIRNITGQEVSIPMFHSQASAWTSIGNGSAEFTLGAFKVLEESERYPDRTILVCPKYYFTYSDGIHLVNTSYRWLGEYYAKAYRAVVVEGGNWIPLKPVQISRSGRVITAAFHVPVPPLVLDTNLVSDPGQYGFQYWDNSGAPPAIETVTLTGTNTVEIVLAGEPGGGGERLRYAFSAPPESPGGPLTGPRGNLRDSDETFSPFGNLLYNWCVHFDKPVKPVD